MIGFYVLPAVLALRVQWKIVGADVILRPWLHEKRSGVRHGVAAAAGEGFGKELSDLEVHFQAKPC